MLHANMCFVSNTKHYTPRQPTHHAGPLERGATGNPPAPAARSEAEIRWRTRTARKEVWEFVSYDRNSASAFLLCSSKRAASARPMPYIRVHQDPDQDRSGS